jgi:hypothetical protein
LRALPQVRADLAPGGRVRLVVLGEFYEDRARTAEAIRRLALEDAVELHDRYAPNEEVALYWPRTWSSCLSLGHPWIVQIA